MGHDTPERSSLTPPGSAPHGSRAPSRGEGIYFAAKSGRMCAETIVKNSKQGVRMIDEEDGKWLVWDLTEIYWNQTRSIKYRIGCQGFWLSSRISSESVLKRHFRSPSSFVPAMQCVVAGRFDGASSWMGWQVWTHLFGTLASNGI